MNNYNIKSVFKDPEMIIGIILLIGVIVAPESVLAHVEERLKLPFANILVTILLGGRFSLRALGAILNQKAAK